MPYLDVSASYRDLSKTVLKVENYFMRWVQTFCARGADNASQGHMGFMHMYCTFYSTSMTYSWFPDHTPLDTPTPLPGT